MSTKEKTMGFWKKKSGLEKKLIVATVVVTLVAIGLLIAVIVVAVKKPDEPDVCDTPECLIAASNLQISLNLTADPCHDFYEYACGGWMANNVISPDRSRWSQFDVTRKTLLDKLRGLLEATYEGNKYPQIVTQATQLYSQCLNSKKRDTGFQELKELVKEWPMINTNTENPNFLWHKSVAKLNREHGFSFILSNYVYLDAKKTSIYSIYVDAPSFGVGRAQLVKPEEPDNVKILDAYKAFIKASVQLLADSPDRVSPTIDADINAIVKFESDLAKLTAEAADRRNRTELYGDKTDIESFVSKYNIPLLDIETQVFENYKPIDGKTGLIVYDKKYFERLANLLTTTINTNKRILANYISWRTVRSLGTHTSKAFRDIEFAFNKVVTGVEEPKALWEECVDLVNNRLPFAVGRVYVDNNFSEEAKQDMNSLIDLLNKAFEQLLDDNEWMQKETKDKAREKLKDMLRAIAYPEFIKSDNELTDYYNGLTINPEKSFLDSINVNNLWATRKSLDKLDKPNNDRSLLEWSTGPAIVNAFFSPNINRITFPAGILQSPFYTYGLPMALNMGGIGMVIGHEITHSFDDSGAQYDKEGNLENWWDEETQNKFTEKVKCFINQYSGYHIESINKNVNGKTTIGENIADNGGLRQAFRVWCTNIRDPALINQIEIDPHSPGKYRVWGSVSNSDSFAKAFNCKPKTTMNPDSTSKCILW
ncbi:unnamed protein product [Medioppia subpectinata]|uniref:Uncharacterized protein n=1 Tax=Medioppia subpectinata TaxID=1979941 RepID=A0A7R9PX72_9ACAR|nr:unnamed protein product [Medioppia subpectinata]CAG2104715.1 unnamed protein product [Medioppia subpectinata]